MILAVRDKVLTLNMLPTMTLQALALYQSLVGDIKMDLTLNDVVVLALLGQQIPKENITNIVIDYNYVTDATTADGQEVLMRDRERIRALRNSLFTTASVGWTAEAARVEVLNGAGIAGLAAATADWLRGQGVNVVAVDTDDRTDYAQTEIVDYTGKPRTAAWLARTFNLLTVTSG